jgi:MFS family permease
VALTPPQRRDLRLLAGLRGVSVLGDSIALVALYLRVAHGGHGPMIAALAIAAALPLVVLAPLAGQVVDRLPAKVLLGTLCGLEGAICVGLGYVRGDVVTIGLMALLTCGVAFSMPGYSALVPTLSGEENVAVAQSTIQSVQGVALTAGPALGGLLVGATGQSWPLYLDAVSFVLAGVVTMFLSGDRRPQRHEEHEATPERDLGVGVRVIFTDTLLRPVMVTVTVFMLSLGAVNVSEVFFITRTLHSNALFYGLVGTSFGLGSIIGSLASRRLGQDPLTLVRVSLLAIASIGVLIGGVGLVDRVGDVYPLMILTGVLVGVINVAFSTLFAVRTPEALRGRVFAASGAFLYGAEMTSMVLGGVLLTVISPRTVFQLAGVSSTLTVLLIAPLELRTSTRARVLP